MRERYKENLQIKQKNIDKQKLTNFIVEKTVMKKKN